MLDFFHLLSVIVVFSFPYSKGFCSYNFGYFFETLYMAALSGLHCPIDIKDGSVRKKVSSSVMIIGWMVLPIPSPQSMLLKGFSEYW